MYRKEQMVIPGNLPSQLHVLDSSQQLYAPLFLAPYSKKTSPRSPPQPFFLLFPLLSFFFLWCPAFFSSFATLLPCYSLVSKHGLPNHSPCCCSRHPTLSFMAARSIWAGFMVREGGVPLPESSSTCQSSTVASKSEVNSL